MTIDWAAVMAVLALLGAAASYGVLRQRVSELRERADKQENNAADRLKEQASQFERVWKALEGLNHTNQAVTALQGSIETLTAQMNAGHTLMLSKLDASDKLTAAKLDTLATSMGKAVKG